MALMLKKWRFLLVASIAVMTLTGGVRAQTVVDKTVATVSDGVKTELITYSDLLWQVALKANVPLSPPSDTDLNLALQLQIDQRIFALEAQRLPRSAPTDKEIADKIAEILSFFTSPEEFERRLKIVGFSSIKDDNFENIISQRVAIEKYIDFRFRSFVVVTADDEAKYYRDTWVTDYRRGNPNSDVPTLEQARARVNTALIEERVAANIETFIEEAKRRVEVVNLAEIK